MNLAKPGGFAIPAPIGETLARLPQFPPSLAFAFGLNLVIRQLANSENLRLLHGRTIRIQVTDAGLSLTFTVAADGFKPLSGATQADVSLSAKAYDFAILAARKEDPDTLFFHRRLLIEGDTELGLLIKNTLDAQEPPKFGLGMLAPSRVLGALRATLRP
ncbi:MAG: SCP2 sterol-binding domain-containing protein [Betaproteobacteria bacterium]|nr:SCP2 sterol-binding domain-containing protein [Betaproteobacteria bacterium]